MAITTKKMRLRSSKRNNKPKTPKRKNNKSYTKKRNSAIKAKKNSRRVRKQRGGEEIISDKELLDKIKGDFLYNRNRETQFGELSVLDLPRVLIKAMTYIVPNFLELSKDPIIEETYSKYKDKIFTLFNKYINYFNTKVNKMIFLLIHVVDLELYLNDSLAHKDYFINPDRMNKPIYSTELIHELLFKNIIPNFLENKQNFRLGINTEHSVLIIGNKDNTENYKTKNIETLGELYAYLPKPFVNSLGCCLFPDDCEEVNNQLVPKNS
jgi:hypothetical protein